MVKAQPGHWEALEVDLETEPRLKRREESFRRREERGRELKRLQDDNKHEYDRKATQEIMRL